MKSETKRRIDQLNNGEIPNGYKKTEFGVFPCDWVTDNKLKDLGVFGKGKGIPGNKLQSEGVPCVGYGDIYMKYDHFYFDKALSFVDKATAKDSQLIKKGTLLFTATGETADEIGKCVCYDGEEDIYAGGDIITFVTQQVNPIFIAYQQYQSFALKKKAGFGQGHSVVHIQKENLEKLNIAYPTSLQEQSKIAKILMTWDKAIELYNKQINQLKNFKSICLKKMFPVKGKVVPEWRLRGFTDAWEQRKLGEIADYTSSNLTAKDALNMGKFDLYDANSVIGKTDATPIRKRYISIIKDGAGVGRVRILPENSAFIGTMGALTANNSDLDFVFALISRADLSKRYSGSTIPHIYFRDYGENKYFVPELAEQKPIGSFFRSLDDLITLHQRKSEMIKKQRKVLQQYLLNGIVRAQK